jgi:hypothetical protein
MGKYIVIRDFKSPVAFSGSSHPALGTQVRQMNFKKGQVIDGVLKTKEDGSPAFIIHRKCVIVPIAAVKELVSKEILSNAEGSSDAPKEKKVITESTSKIKYIDSAIIGGAIGFALTWFLEKRGIIPADNPENKVPHQNKLIGLAIGAAAGAYYTYKKNVKTGIKIVKDKSQTK